MVKSDLDEPDTYLRHLKQDVGGHDDIPIGPLADAVAQATGLTDLTLTPMPVPATFHAAFSAESPDGNNRVLVRAARSARPELTGAMALNKAIHAACRDRGPRTPAILHFDPSHDKVPFDYEVIEFVDGATLAQREGDEGAFCEGLERAAEALAQCHGIAVSGFGPLDPAAVVDSTPPLRGLFDSWGEYLLVRADDHLAILRQHDEIDADDERRIRIQFGHLGDIEPPAPRLLHGDMDSTNIILGDDDTVTLLDWEDALAGDPLFDLAQFATFQPQRRHRHIRIGYERRRPLDDDHAIAFWLYFLRLSVAKQVHRIRFGLSGHPRHGKARERIFTALEKLEGGSCAFC